MDAATDFRATPETGTARKRAGVAFVVLAAASGGLLLILPVGMVGYTISVLVSVMRGEYLAWQTVVGMSYGIGGIPALISLFLLVIPYELSRAAGRRLGTRQAVMWVGGLLVVWHAGVAAISAWDPTSGFSRAAAGDGPWFAVAFGVTAVAILIATVVAAKRSAAAAVAVVGLPAVVLAVALVAVLIAVWGSAPGIPLDAQTVHVVVTASEVRLNPATVHAGDVYFVISEPDDPTGHSGFTFVQRGIPSGDECGPLLPDAPPPDCTIQPGPLSDDDLARFAHGDYQGAYFEGGWGGHRYGGPARGEVRVPHLRSWRRSARDPASVNGRPRGPAVTRAGVAFVVLAAASGALLLFPPVTILGYTFTVLVAVMRGEGLAWGSVVGMSYGLGGIAALLSLFLLVIPYALLRAASRRLGTRQAVNWIGGLLVVWHAGVAAVLVWGGGGDERLIASAFGVAASAILIATVAAARLGTRQAVIWVGGLLVVWHAHVAAMLALVATRAPGIGAEGLSIAFGVAAAAYLIATVVAAKRAAGGGRSRAAA